MVAWRRGERRIGSRRSRIAEPGTPNQRSAALAVLTHSVIEAKKQRNSKPGSDPLGLATQAALYFGDLAPRSHSPVPCLVAPATSIMNTSAPTPYPSTRVHPRLKFATPVHVQVGVRSFLCNTEDISLGGLQAKYSQPPPALTQLRLLFNLPNGSSVIADAIVRYTRGDHFGVQFLGLSNGTHAALQDYTSTAQAAPGEEIASPSV